MAVHFIGGWVTGVLVRKTGTSGIKVQLGNLDEKSSFRQFQVSALLAGD